MCSSPNQKEWSASDPTNPRSCILLNCLPLDRADFISDFKSWPLRDFARSVTGYRRPEDAWNVDGAALATSLSAVLDAADLAGIATVPHATSADFVRAFEDRNVIILLAHWKGARLLPRDILDEPDAIVAAITCSARDRLSAETVDWLLPRCGEALDRVMSMTDPGQRREYFASLLNEVIIQIHSIVPGLLPPGADRELVVGDIWLETWGREMLDRCARPLIVPGNQVEMRDGLQDPAALVRQIQPAWSGLVDLTMCQSALFGHLIKRGRGDRGILARRRAVDPAIALAILRRLVIDIGTGSFNYTSRYAEMFQTTSRLVHELFTATPSGS